MVHTTMQQPLPRDSLTIADALPLETVIAHPERFEPPTPPPFQRLAGCAPGQIHSVIAALLMLTSPLVLLTGAVKEEDVTARDSVVRVMLLGTLPCVFAFSSLLGIWIQSPTLIAGGCFAALTLAGMIMYHFSTNINHEWDEKKHIISIGELVAVLFLLYSAAVFAKLSQFFIPRGDAWSRYPDL